MKHKSLAVGIVFLFIITSVTPMVIGYKSNDYVSSESEELMDILAFMYYDDRGDNERYEYYKEHLLNDYPNDDLEIAEVVEPVESSPVASFDGPMDSPWPMKCYNTRHTGRSLYSTTENPFIEKWRFQTNSFMEDTAVIGNDGTIYLEGSYGGLPYYIYALYPNGTMKWRFNTGDLIWGSSPAIDENGTIYVGNWGDYLYAIFPNGTEKWRFYAHDTIASSPAIAEDGTIYFGTMGNRVFALNPNGSEKWNYDTGSWITSDPAIGDDGTVYIGSADCYLYALYPNGTLRWRFETGHYVKGPPSISDDGTIYFGSYDDYLYALYPNNGTMKWQCAIGYGTETNPSVADDGTIYVGGRDLYAIYPNGTMRWVFELGNRDAHQSSPAISSDGTIFFGVEIGNMEGGEIIALNPDGTERWRKKFCNDWTESSPSIGEDGTIYIGGASGYLYAFGRGELVVDAGGPYSGIAGQDIQFTGTIFGGIPPYSYHWDFGDGNISEEQNPKHAYLKSGEYIVMFTVTDSEDNSSSDNATVSVDYALPTVKITKPENALYLLNVKLIPLPKPLIIGNIGIEVDASQDEVGIDRVEFYIDDELKSTDTSEPYSWIWDDRVFFRYTIKVVAVAQTEESDSDSIEVRKFL